MALCSLNDVREWLGVHDPIDDVQLDLARTAAAAAIQSHTGHQFDLDNNATARVFVARSATLLDMSAVGSTVGNTTGLTVKTDDDDDGVFEVTWSSGDWQTEPHNSAGPGGLSWPVTTLRAVGTRSFPVGGLGRPRVQVTARWGWPAVPDRVKLAAVLLTAAWHQRRATMTGRGGFDGFFTSAIADDQTITDLLGAYRAGDAIVGIA